MTPGRNFTTLRYACGHEITHRWNTADDLDQYKRWAEGDCSACIRSKAAPDD